MNGLALAVTIASGVLVYRQRLTPYHIVRSLVLGIYVLAASYMWTYGVDANGIMCAANSVIFFVVIRNFRMSASLAGFVERPVPSAPAAAAPPGRMSPLTESLAGKKLLYEVDPRVPYETTPHRTSRS